VRVFSVGEISILLRTAVAFCAEELDVRLRGSQAHGIATFFAGSIFPRWLVGETIVETCVGEGAKGEGGEGAAFLLFPLAVGFAEGVRLVEEVVVGYVWLGCKVEYEYDLGGSISQPTIGRGQGSLKSHQMIHKVLAHTR
jgi:hypothetical protein